MEFALVTIVARSQGNEYRNKRDMIIKAGTALDSLRTEYGMEDAILIQINRLDGKNCLQLSGNLAGGVIYSFVAKEGIKINLFLYDILNKLTIKNILFI